MMNKWWIVLLSGLLLSGVVQAGQAKNVSADGKKCCQKSATQPADASGLKLLSVTKIWDATPHCAFTDLIRFKGQWFCTFREGQKHQYDAGSIRVIHSKDGKEWNSAALLSEEGQDLRDPKLAIHPDGRLMLLGMTRNWPKEKEDVLKTWVSFSEDGKTWSPRKQVAETWEWLWRITWHKGVAYGIAFDPSAKSIKDWFAWLYRSDDGVHYKRVTKIDSYPGLSEASLRFDEKDRMYCVLRRDWGTKTALLGTSEPPYKEWKWQDTGHHLGGPALVRYKGQWWAAGRWLDKAARTVVARADYEKGTLTPVIELPSGGDTSYPSFVEYEDTLWMTYYSSHEGKTWIYLAVIE